VVAERNAKLADHKESRTYRSGIVPDRHCESRYYVAVAVNTKALREAGMTNVESYLLERLLAERVARVESPAQQLMRAVRENEARYEANRLAATATA
jgi:hypothetical protein